MPERTLLGEGLMASGLDPIKNKSGHERSSFTDQLNFPIRPAEEHPDSASIRDIFPASVLDAVIEGAITPVVTEQEILLPTHFALALADVHQTLIQMSNQDASPVVLERAVEILAQDEYLRELVRIHRNALVQA